MSKLHLEDQLAHAASIAPCNGHGKSDGEEVSHIQPEVPPTESVSKLADLDSEIGTAAEAPGAAATKKQGAPGEKGAQAGAPQPSTGCDTAVEVTSQLEDSSADPSSAALPAAASEMAHTQPLELLQAASSSGAPPSPSLPDGDTEELGETGGGSAEDEGNDNASVSSDGTLDCTSTPVAIGHDPFAGFRRTGVTHAEGPKFQYGSLVNSLLTEDSRSATASHVAVDGLACSSLILQCAVREGMS